MLKRSDQESTLKRKDITDITFVFFLMLKGDFKGLC